MALTSLPIYRDTYRLMRMVLHYIKNFPRMYKYTLGDRMINASLDLVEMLQLAKASYNDGKSRKDALDSIKDLESYNYKEGYPEKLVF